MKITVFGATWCAFCSTQKQWLDSKGIKFDYHNIDEDDDARAYLRDISDAQSVPVTVIEKNNNISIVNGFDRKKLSEIIEI